MDNVKYRLGDGEERKPNQQNDNTPERENVSDDNKREEKGKKRNVSALRAASVGRSAVDAARRHHHHDQWSNQGANISYEGPTAPGGAGSVGSGYASGSDDISERIHTSSEYEEGHLGTEHHRNEKENKKKKK